MALPIVFLPDTELVLPGRSGLQPALPELETRCADLIQSALAQIRRNDNSRHRNDAPPQVAVFYTPRSKFNRPLPGFHIASQLLLGAGFKGKILDVVTDLDPKSAPFEGASLWLIMGTGAATHGPSAPLVIDPLPAAPQRPETAPDRPETAPQGLETSNLNAGAQPDPGQMIDAELTRVLQEGNWRGFKNIDLMRSQEVGATLAMAGAAAARAFSMIENGSCHPQNFHFEQFGGVTYFAASWSARKKAAN